MLKLARVSNRVTKRHFRIPVSKKCITLRYTPSLVETLVNGHNLDDFVKGVIATEIITVGVKIFIVMFNLETKKYMYEDVPGPNTIGVDPSSPESTASGWTDPSSPESTASGWTDPSYECYVGEDYSYDCREVLQDRDQESHW